LSDSVQGLSNKKLSIGWFSTGRGEGSYGLLSSALEAIDSGDLNAELAFVFVNRVKGQTKRTDRFLELVESRGFPWSHFRVVISGDLTTIDRGQSSEKILIGQQSSCLDRTLRILRFTPATC